jgi:DNA-directed RNA polymerase subunit L
VKIEVLENKKDFLRIRVPDLTLVNLLNENIWNEDVDFAAFRKEHIYLTEPELIVRSKNPKKTVLSAAEQIITDTKELKKQLKHALKEK